MDQQYVYMIEWSNGTLISAAKVWLISGLILSALFTLRVAALVAFIKVAIVMVYFCFFSDGIWFYGGDDYTYYEKGMEFLSSGANPLSITREPVFRWYFFAKTGFAFQIYYNYLALYLLEPRYYAPVLGLVVVNCMTVVLLVKALAIGNAQKLYASILAIFLLLHWHTIAWTSFLDIKDPLVGLGMAIGIYLITRFRSNPLIFGSLFAGLIYSFHWLRFYFPVFFAGSIFLSNAIILSWRMRVVLVLVGVPIGVYVLSSQIGLAAKMSELESIVYGLVHFLLQPAPWRITEPASYLFIPSIIHWLMVIPTVVGAMLLIKRRTETGVEVGIVFISVFILGVLFYAAVPAIASTRHRSPLDLLMAVMQFHFFWWVLQYWAKNGLKDARLAGNQHHNKVLTGQEN